MSGATSGNASIEITVIIGRAHLSDSITSPGAVRALVESAIDIFQSCAVNAFRLFYSKKFSLNRAGRLFLKMNFKKIFCLAFCLKTFLNQVKKVTGSSRTETLAIRQGHEIVRISLAATVLEFFARPCPRIVPIASGESAASTTTDSRLVTGRFWNL